MSSKGKYLNLFNKSGITSKPSNHFFNKELCCSWLLGGACDNNHAEPSSVQDSRLVPQQAKGYQRWQVFTGTNTDLYQRVQVCEKTCVDLVRTVDLNRVKGMDEGKKPIHTIFLISK